MIEKWNERYRQADDEWDDPLPFFLDAVSDLPPGRALDLACGLGRHAMWLAEHGWQVTAVDGSEVAIGKLRRRGVPMETIVANIEAPGYRIEGRDWDLIVDTFFLHRPLLSQIREALRPGGVAVLAFHLTGTFAIGLAEVDRLIADYEVLHYLKHEVAPAVELVLRKPL